MTTYYAKNRDRMLEHQKKKYKELSSIFQDWKGTLSCTRCGENDISCIEFHHVDEVQKEGNIIHMVPKGIKSVLRELKKCIVVCSNCHSKIHHYNIPSETNGEVSEQFEIFYNTKTRKTLG